MTAPRRAGRLDAHLRAYPDAPPEAGWAEFADVLVASAPLGAQAAERRLTFLFRRYPGCLVAASTLAEGGCLVGTRDGSRLWAAPEGPAAHADRAAGAALASLLHGWLVLGRSPAELDGARVRSAEGAVRLAASRETAPRETASRE
ncbi:hypothetical protein [Streptomyces hoynatensis]|uniref:Uncharacterized protein n=1 Tax=Streptomyces hoynatensis TaxID=1141874 RepID=A0A3A9ZBZ3_9ACTN|nr:hypothetical protein [Streptomyces hoynatensis]RKN45629.1 hypothetical protein D7294_03925 [Streptomyces hoynatensis]